MSKVCLCFSNALTSRQNTDETLPLLPLPRPRHTSDTSPLNSLQLSKHFRGFPVSGRNSQTLLFPGFLCSSRPESTAVTAFPPAIRLACLIENVRGRIMIRNRLHRCPTLPTARRAHPVILAERGQMASAMVIATVAQCPVGSIYGIIETEPCYKPG